MVKTVLGTLVACIDQLAKIHTSRITPGWFVPEKRSISSLVCATVLVTLAVSANVYVRHMQFQIWQSATPYTQIFDSPTFSTADAPYFLAHAVTIQRRTCRFLQFNSVYPNNLEEAQQQTITACVITLLSTLIAIFAVVTQPNC